MLKFDATYMDIKLAIKSIYLCMDKKSAEVLKIKQCGIDKEM